MLPDRVSSPGPPTYQSGALPIALRGPANAEERLKKMKPGLEAHWMPPTKKCVRKFEIWYTLIGEFRWKK